MADLHAGFRMLVSEICLIRSWQGVFRHLDHAVTVNRIVPSSPLWGVLVGMEKH